MDAGGFTRSYRRRWTHPVFRNLRDAAIWAWMTDVAAWRETAVRFEGRVVNLTRGQLVTSERFVAEGFVVDRQVVRRLWDTLEREQMIARKKTHGGTIITVCNYDKFQAQETAEKTHVEPTTAPQHNPPENPPAQTVSCGDSVVIFPSGGGVNPPENPGQTHHPHGIVPNKKEGKKESSYFFEGVVVKLNAADYNRWKDAYHAIPDLDAELRRIDAEYVAAGGSPKGGWFVATERKLNYRHQQMVQRQTAPIKAAGKKMVAAAASAPVLSDEELWRGRLKTYRDKGFWSEGWGSRPEAGNSQIPKHLLEEHRRLSAGPQLAVVK